jgi:hypothetical protein
MDTEKFKYHHIGIPTSIPIDGAPIEFIQINKRNNV